MATVEKPERPSIDAVTLEVMRNGFIQICEEVTITMLKTAHSVIFNEGKDLSTAVFDRDGRLIAQDMQGCPVHIAAMPQSVKAGIAQYGIENMNAGRRLPGQRLLQRRHAPARRDGLRARSSGRTSSSASSATAATTPTSAAWRRARCPATPRRCTRRA